MRPEISGNGKSLQLPGEQVVASSTPAPNRADLLARGFISQDPKVLEVLDMVAQVANTDATVLITGESGTGKEFIARSLHEKSGRDRAPFLAVNCGAIAETLQESELFGHARGAFTGATEARIGRFEAAHRGTIFLDEISEMSKALQVKLLRVLQYGEYAPVGSTENRLCDVRVIAATNQNLRPLIAAGVFRPDLYYRLNVIRLELPPLRQRRNDIPLLINHFLHIFGATYHKPHLQLHADTRDLLLRYDFPGNVRELENIIRRAVILCRDRLLVPGHLTPEVLTGLSAPTQVADFHSAKAHALEAFERSYLLTILVECGGIVSRAARRSGLSERNFHQKLKKYGICGKDYRARVEPNARVYSAARLGPPQSG